METRSKVCVVIPVHNESELINRLIDSVVSNLITLGTKWEIIIVDDGSTDDTEKLVKEWKIKEVRIHCLRLLANIGQQNAIFLGLQMVDSDFIIVMDGDLQDPPSLIPKLYEALRKDGSDIVIGRRIKRKISRQYQIFQGLFHFLARKLINRNFNKAEGNFCIFSKEVLWAYLQTKRHSRYLPFDLRNLGFAVSTLEFSQEANQRMQSGKSRYSWRKRAEMALSVLFATSPKPIFMMMYSGVLLSFLSFILLVFYAIRKVVGANPVPGWTSLVVIVLFGFGIQFLFTGILSLFLGSRLGENSTRGIPVRWNGQIEIKYL